MPGAKKGKEKTSEGHEARSQQQDGHSVPNSQSDFWHTIIVATISS